MAGRPRARMKQAYKMTSRRKAALRKAQLASAAKRKRNAKRVATAVGVVGLIGVASYAGSRYGSGKSLAADLKGRKFSMTDLRNKAAARIAVDPDNKENVMRGSAVSRPPQRWRAGKLTVTDPVKSAPSEAKAAKNSQPKRSTPPKPDAAPNNQGGMSSAPKLGNTAAVPGTIRQKDIKDAVEIPPQSAESGRQGMENAPKIGKDGKEIKQPKRDVWGESNDFQPWTTDKIISMAKGGKVHEGNLWQILGHLAGEQERLGKPLTNAQKNRLAKLYSRIFQVPLPKKKK